MLIEVEIDEMSSAVGQVDDEGFRMSEPGLAWARQIDVCHVEFAVDVDVHGADHTSVVSREARHAHVAQRSVARGFA